MTRFTFVKPCSVVRRGYCGCSEAQRRENCRKAEFTGVYRSLPELPGLWRTPAPWLVRPLLSFAQLCSVIGQTLLSFAQLCSAIGQTLLSLGTWRRNRLGMGPWPPQVPIAQLSTEIFRIRSQVRHSSVQRIRSSPFTEAHFLPIRAEFVTFVSKGGNLKVKIPF